MKKSKKVIITSIIAATLIVGVGLATLGLKDDTAIANENVSEEMKKELQEQLDMVKFLIERAGERVESKEYENALKDYETAKSYINEVVLTGEVSKLLELNQGEALQEIASLKEELPQKIEDTKAIIENTAKENSTTEVEIFENTKQEDTDQTTPNSNTNNGSGLNNSSASNSTSSNQPVKNTTEDSSNINASNNTNNNANTPNTSSTTTSNNTSNDEFNKLFEEAFGIHPDQIQGGQVDGGEIADFEITGNVIGH